jgi:hypothetical protein
MWLPRLTESTEAIGWRELDKSQTKDIHRWGGVNRLINPFHRFDEPQNGNIYLSLHRADLPVPVQMDLVT